jgi:hypothetical protein
MDEQALTSLEAYSRFVAETVSRPSVQRSTLRVWPESPYTGVAEGEVFFAYEIRLRLREELDFDAGLITGYGYEVYRGAEKRYWYDDFPHPNDPTLAETHPHHKHIPPNIKRNRIPAPGLSYVRPNLLQLITEIEEWIDRSDADDLPKIDS